MSSPTPSYVPSLPDTAEILAAKRARALDQDALRTLFTEARTANGFLAAPVDDTMLRDIVELAELAPTAANGLPMRVVFVRGAEAKERLRPALSAANVEKTMAAPVTAIVAADPRFYDHLPRTFPHADARAWFAGDEKAAFALEQARFNATLQAGYLILAARAFGLDAGPMGGFDAATVDRAFFAESGYRSLVLINLGYGDDTKLFPRNPRLRFDEVAAIL